MPDIIPTNKSAQVLHNGRPATIDRQVGLDRKLIIYEDGSSEIVKYTKLSRLRETGDPLVNEIPMEAYKETQIKLARKRLEVIAPILEDSKNRTKRIREAIKKTGLSKSTIYRWLRDFECSPRITSLVSKASRKRNKRLDPRVERIIEDTIKEEYLKPKQVSKKRIFESVKEQCQTARLKIPHPNTVNARINALSQKSKTKGRRGAKIAREIHDPNKGTFPEGRFPLECVQMDTQKLDIIVVDSVDRQAIGRPYLTVAVDTFSRMIVGYYLSLESASSYTAGACIYRMLLPKDGILEKFKINGSWPVWGLPVNLHVDNGSDFKSDSVRRACDKHTITIEFRPPGFPNWGGHVEAFFKTLTHWVHDLDGTTTSKPQELHSYDAIKNSTMTMEEIEKWFLTFIVYVYHERLHSSMEVPPIRRWEDGIRGTNGFAGIGTPDIPDDTRDLRLDFLPSKIRTVSKYGIRWDNIYYNADVLDVWVNEKQGGKSVKHIVRRDPHNISKIYFFDPTVEKYFEVPYSNISHPSIDVWELRRAQEFLAKRGIKKAEQDEDKIFEGIMLMRAIERDSRAKTVAASRKTRRKAEQKRKHAATALPAATKDKNEEIDKGNITRLPTKPKSRFAFSGKRKSELVDDTVEQDFGEWS